MANMTFWNKTEDLIFPAGFSTAEDYKAQNPWTVHGKVVIEKVRGTVVGLHSFSVLCENFKIPDDLDDDAALEEINHAVSTQKFEQQAAMEKNAAKPADTERIAAALEYQNLMNL